MDGRLGHRDWERESRLWRRPITQRSKRIVDSGLENIIEEPHLTPARLYPLYNDTPGSSNRNKNARKQKSRRSPSCSSSTLAIRPTDRLPMNGCMICCVSVTSRRIPEPYTHILSLVSYVPFLSSSCNELTHAVLEESERARVFIQDQQQPQSQRTDVDSIHSFCTRR